MTAEVPTNSETTLAAVAEQARRRYVAANPESRRLNVTAAEVMPGGNTRSVLHYTPFPLVLVGGEGATVFDADGHRYTDFLGEYTAGLYGHSHPAIVEAIETAVRGGIVLGGPNLVEERFARAICQRFPAIERVRFCNSGTEANLFALSAARAFTGRQAVVVMEGGYHGGVLNFTGHGHLNVPMPFHLAPYNDVSAATRIIRRLGGDLAAVIVEPMMGAGGCLPGTPEFLGALRGETEDVGALLVFDEVMTSRLARGGLHDELGIAPDLVVLGKYIGGGSSFGAFGGRADIMDRFDPRRADSWSHPGTFNNNIITMSAGLAGLTRVFTPDAVDGLNARGDALRERLAECVGRRGLPIRVTGRGSMIGFHFARRPVNAPGDAPPAPAELWELIHLDLLDRGQYTARRGMLSLSLMIDDDDATAFVEAYDDVLASRADAIEAATPG